MRTAGNGPSPSGLKKTPVIVTLSSWYAHFVPSSLNPGSGSANTGAAATRWTVNMTNAVGRHLCNMATPSLAVRLLAERLGPKLKCFLVLGVIIRLAAGAFQDVHGVDTQVGA